MIPADVHAAGADRAGGVGVAVPDRAPGSDAQADFTQLSALRQHLRALGARPAHEQRVLRLWSQALPQDSGRRRLEDFLPTDLRTALPALVWARSSSDGTMNPSPAVEASRYLTPAL